MVRKFSTFIISVGVPLTAISLKKHGVFVRASEGGDDLIFFEGGLGGFVLDDSIERERERVDMCICFLMLFFGFDLILKKTGWFETSFFFRLLKTFSIDRVFEDFYVV